MMLLEVYFRGHIVLSLEHFFEGDKLQTVPPLKEPKKYVNSYSTNKW